MAKSNYYVLIHLEKNRVYIYIYIYIIKSDIYRKTHILDFFYY